MDAANYTRHLMAAFQDGEMPEPMPLTTLREMAGSLAKLRVGEDGDWQGWVDETMARFEGLDQGEVEHLRWFATGVLTGMLAPRLIKAPVPR